MHPIYENKTLMDMIELLSEFRAREMDVTVSRLNREVVATIKISVQ